jgi:hypothetical protein
MLRLSTRLSFLADACDLSINPDRELDAMIAVEIFPFLRDLDSTGPGQWVRPGGEPVFARRYTLLPLAALSLLPTDHWIEFESASGPVKAFAQGRPSAVAVGRNRRFPLAAAAAALRARAALAKEQIPDGSGFPMIGPFHSGPLAAEEAA